MADTKLADLTAITTPSGDDILYVVDDPAGTPLDRKLALNNLFTRGTVTTSSPVIDAAQTWNAGGVTFTGLKFNATDTASAAASLLMDLQVGGSSRVRATKDGQLFSNGANNSGMFLFFTSGAAAGFFNSAQTPGGAGNFTQCYSVAGASFVAYAGGGARGGIFGRLNGGASLELSSSGQILFSSGSDPAGGADTILTRRAAANLRLGAADAAAPVAQTLSVQSVVAGTTNTAGANLTITGSQGTGTGAGGSIIFQVAPAGSSGTAQNALTDALTITSNRRVTVAENIVGPLGNTGAVLGGLVLGFAGVSTGNLAGGQIQLFETGTLRFRITDTALNMYNSAELSWSSATGASGTADVRLFRDAANTLALRNGTNAQTFNIYNTFTSSTNFERFRVFAQSADTVLIGTEKGSGGGTARALALQTDATTRLTLTTLGSVVVNTAAVATTATDGFLYVPTCAGTPTGTPTTQTGTAPIVVDTTNNKLYFYSGAQWRDAGP